MQNAEHERTKASNWGEQLGDFCAYYKCLPWDVYDLTIGQWNALAAAMTRDQERNQERGGYG
jgi:hypothetical protein